MRNGLAFFLSLIFLKAVLEIHYIGLHCYFKELLPVIKKKDETSKPDAEFQFRFMFPNIIESSKSEKYARKYFSA